MTLQITWKIGASPLLAGMNALCRKPHLRFCRLSVIKAYVSAGGAETGGKRAFRLFRGVKSARRLFSRIQRRMQLWAVRGKRSQHGRITHCAVIYY